MLSLSAMIISASHPPLSAGGSKYFVLAIWGGLDYAVFPLDGAAGLARGYSRGLPFGDQLK